MFERLEQIETRYEDLGRQMADPELHLRPAEVPEGSQAAPRP